MNLEEVFCNYFLGTSTADGIGITLAVCEELLKSNAFVFFATHFQEIVSEMSNYSNCTNMFLQV